MRKLLLTGTAFLLLSSGAVLAHGGIKNASSGGSGTSASATTGGTAVSKNSSTNTKVTQNTKTTTTVKTNTNTKTVSNSNSNNSSVVKVIGSNYAADGSTLSLTRSNTNINIKLATASTEGTVKDDMVVFKDHSRVTSDATMTNVNGGTGILTAQQNTGANSLQQSSVALGSYISGNSNTLP